jgi:hypothetical protein
MVASDGHQSIVYRDTADLRTGVSSAGMLLAFVTSFGEVGDCTLHHRLRGTHGAPPDVGRRVPGADRNASYLFSIVYFAPVQSLQFLVERQKARFCGCNQGRRQLLPWNDRQAAHPTLVLDSSSLFLQ